MVLKKGGKKMEWAMTVAVVGVAWAVVGLFWVFSKWED